MARNHARVLTTLWVDGEWTALSGRAQWLYLLLLSQPRLTLVGSLDYRPGRWSTLAHNMTVDSVEGAVSELEQARYVVVDRDAEEVIIRSFTKYDISPGRCNSNIIRGLWNAWTGVYSLELRRVVVENLPEDLWNKAEPFAPDGARQMRRSGRLEPEQPSRSEPGTAFRSEPPSTVSRNRFEPKPSADAGGRYAHVEAERRIRQAEEPSHEEAKAIGPEYIRKAREAAEAAARNNGT